MVGSLKKQTIMQLAKPMILRCCILDLPNMVLANCHYAQIKSKYGKHAMSIYSDTYSLFYLIVSDIAYDDMVKDNAMLNDRFYPTYHAFDKMNIIGKSEHGAHIMTSCKVPGAFKSDNSYHVCKPMVVCRVTSYAEEIALFVVDNCNTHAHKLGRCVPSTIRQHQIHDDMYEGRLCKKTYVNITITQGSA